MTTSKLSLWDRFSQRLARQQPAIVEVQNPTILRKKKWVVFDNRIGILADVTNGGASAVIHFTDPIKGENIGVEIVPAGQVRIARWMEIPANRRPVQQDVANALGYF